MKKIAFTYVQPDFGRNTIHKNGTFSFSRFLFLLMFSASIFLFSGLSTVVNAQDFGDEDSSSADSDGSDDSGFSFGDDDSSDSDDSNDSGDSKGSDDSDFGFGSDSDSDSEDEENSGSDEDSESEEASETADETEIAEDSETEQPETVEAQNGRKISAAKKNPFNFPSNGSAAGEEAKITLHGVEYRFRWIPKGSFLMGSPMEEVHRKLDEKQMEAVVPHGFWMLETEVTVQMFASFVKATGYKTDAERDESGACYVDVKTGRIEGPEPGFSWKKIGYAQEKQFPVTNVSWYDAQKFVEWFNSEISTHEDPIDSMRQARLPSEMQWEYACRAGTTSRYSCGEKLNNLVEHANLRAINLNETLMGSSEFKFTPWTLSIGQPYLYTGRVGSFYPNAWGLFDMHGNVWEWCEDGYADYEQVLIPNTNSPKLQQFLGRTGSAVRFLKVMRGGGWNTDYGFARSAARASNPPSRRFVDLGFRFIVLPMEPEKVKEEGEEDGDSGVADSLFGSDDEKEEKSSDDEKEDDSESAEAAEDSEEAEEADDSEDSSGNDSDSDSDDSDGGFSF